MRMRSPSAQAQARLGTWKAWKARWLELTVAVAAVIVAAVCLTKAWTAPLELDPLLAVVPALAGIGAVTVRRPLAYGAAALAAAALVDVVVDLNASKGF